ncbi:MAG: 23S rRNA (pseudouridine(1915)-N(3))-methyltransferase RlmH [Epsilonproteobacteria bacterium]|nr:23S rRNA (pseudouridine(1915)-N(3))-methyltransferase RlmH [Campylobacterota bacterium]
MHRVTVYSIGKRDDPCLKELIGSFITQSRRFARIEFIDIFDKRIKRAQSREEGREAYQEALLPFLARETFNIALDPRGEELESHQFAQLIREHPRISFYIGGAYGLPQTFLDRCHRTISLSKLTLSHKVAKIVLAEQLFRAFSIINNHPYHK